MQPTLGGLGNAVGHIAKMQHKRFCQLCRPLRNKTALRVYKYTITNLYETASGSAITKRNDYHTIMNTTIAILLMLMSIILPPINFLAAINVIVTTTITPLFIHIIQRFVPIYTASPANPPNTWGIWTLMASCILEE
jgi:hypothetical protein